MRIHQLNFPALALLLLTAACASTGATFRSGVGDTYLEHPPYYAGRSAEAVRNDTGRVGYLPIAYQRGASQSVIFDPGSGSGTPIEALLREMNGYLDSLATAASLLLPSSGARGLAGVPPDVRFGCIPENGVPGNDCAERGDSALGRGLQQMALTVGRPSADWIARADSLMRENGTARTLVITLEVGQYLMRQEGLLGRKVVELGTGNRASLPWLTSLETPVSVLQLTAALVERDGKAVRIGAEGFYAHRTRLAVSAIGGQELIRDEEVREARAQRREDLPGAPLAWKVALRELVTRMAGRP
jgi:hypothetical protein